jgi:hypothetical protein
MRLTIDEYQINDEVDVFPRKSDTFDEFTGVITEIDYDEDIIYVKDEYDDIHKVDAAQIRLTYAEESDSLYD